MGAAVTTRPLRIVTSTDPERDHELVARIAGGDLGALGALYDRHAPALLRFIRRYCPDEDAEDVLQNTFLRSMAIAHRFENGASAKPWLFGVSLQLLRERRRSLRRWSALLLSLATQPPRVSPEPSAAARELSRALGGLSDAKRCVVLLAEVEGFTCGEIAEILEVPVGTVWTRLHHARRALRKSLEESR